MKFLSVPALGSIMLLILALALAGCLYNPAPGGIAVPPKPLSPAGNQPAACGFTTCHGADVACGTNPPGACTMQYAFGDKCRQYAYCNSSGSSCRLVTTTAYDACRACIQRCGGADSGEILSCEEKC